MSSSKTWKNNFQSKQNSFSISLIESLKNNLMDEAKYQQWASKYYKLPVLQSNYFINCPGIDIQFWNKMRNQPVWNQSLIPLFEWDKTLYVACLEPRPQLQKIYKDQEIVFLLTSVKNLDSLWGYINQNFPEQELNEEEEDDEILKANKDSSIDEDSQLSMLNDSEEDADDMLQTSQDPSTDEDSKLDDSEEDVDDMLQTSQDPSTDEDSKLDDSEEDVDDMLQTSQDPSIDEDSSVLDDFEENEDLQIEQEEEKEEEATQEQNNQNDDDENEISFLTEKNTLLTHLKNLFKNAILFVFDVFVTNPKNEKNIKIPSKKKSSSSDAPDEENFFKSFLKDKNLKTTLSNPDIFNLKKKKEKNYKEKLKKKQSLKKTKPKIKSTEQILKPKLTSNDSEQEIKLKSEIKNIPQAVKLESDVEETEQIIISNTEKKDPAKKENQTKSEKKNTQQTIQLESDVEETEQIIISNTEKKDPAKKENQTKSEKKNTQQTIQLESDVEEAEQIIISNAEKKDPVKKENQTKSEKKNNDQKIKSESETKLEIQEEISSENSQILSKQSTEIIIEDTLKEISKYFDSYILFIFKKKKFIPYKWSSHLKPKNNNPIPVEKPSLFRICYRTKQPYFGHATPILTNNTFFENWGFESLPQNVILMPILNKSKDTLMGGYLGISKEQDLSINFLDTFQERIKPLLFYFEDDSILKKVS